MAERISIVAVSIAAFLTTINQISIIITATSKRRDSELSSNLTKANNILTNMESNLMAIHTIIRYLIPEQRSR